MMELGTFKKWAEDKDAELVQVEETKPAMGSLDPITIQYHMAVFERYDGPVIRNDELWYRPRSFVKVNEHVDEFEVQAGDSLNITLETWVDPGGEQYEKHEGLESVGQAGGNIQVSNFQSLKFLETAEDGFRRQVTVEVDED